ncbi:hypothetical protein ACOMHN_014571 [Nucella lapillus]
MDHVYRVWPYEAREGEKCVQSEDQESGEGGEEFGAASFATSVSSLSSLSDSEEEGEECLTLSLVSSVPSLSVQIADLQSPDDLPSDEDQREPESTAHLSARPAAPEEEEEEELLDYEEEMALQLPQEEYLDMGWDRQLPEWVGRVEDFFLLQEAREGEQCVQSEDQESGEGGEEFGAASPATSVSSLSSLSDSEEEGEECLTLSLSPDDLPSDEDQREPESTAHLSARPAAPEKEKEELLDYEEEMALQLPQEEYLDMGWDRQLPEWVGRVEDFFLLQEAREGEQCVQSEDQESGEGGEEFGAASPATSVSSLSSLSDSEEEGEECMTLSLVSSVPSLSVQIADLQSPDDLPSDEDQREPESTAHLSARPAAPENGEEELLDYEEEMALQLPQEEYLDMGWDRQLPEWVGRVEDFFLLQEAREGEQCVQSEDQESGEGGEEFGAASPATSVSSLSSLSDSEEEGEECLTLSLVSSVPSLSVQIADLQSPDDLPSDEDQREPESTAHLSARPAAPENGEEELLDYEEEMALQLPQEEYLDMGWDRQLPEWVGRVEDFFLLQEAREGEQCVQSEDQESGEGGEEFGAASPSTSVSSLSSLSDSEEEGEECLTLSLVSSVPSLSVQIADLQSPDDLPSDEDQREPESTAHLSARPAAPEEEEEELLDYEEEMALQLSQEEYLDMGWDRQLPEWIGRVEDFFLLQEAREGEQCVQSEDQESGEGGEEFGAASPATSVSSLASLSDSEEEGEECLTLSLVSSVPSLSVQIADLQSPDDLPSDEDQREPESTAHLSARPAAPEEEEEELLDYEEEMALQLPQKEYLDMGWDRQLPEWVGR